MSQHLIDQEQDQYEAADAERACLELKGQIARARRIVDRAREVLSHDVEAADQARA